MWDCIPQKLSEQCLTIAGGDENAAAIFTSLREFGVENCLESSSCSRAFSLLSIALGMEKGEAK